MVNTARSLEILGHAERALFCRVQVRARVLGAVVFELFTAQYSLLETCELDGGAERESSVFFIRLLPHFARLLFECKHRGRLRRRLQYVAEMASGRLVVVLLWVKNRHSFMGDTSKWLTAMKLGASGTMLQSRGPRHGKGLGGLVRG